MQKFTYLLIACFLSLGSIASAQTTYFVDKSASGNNDGTSWTDAYVELDSALIYAVSGDTVKVAEGVYIPDLNRAREIPALPRQATFFIEEDIVMLGAFPSGGGTRDYENNLTILSGDVDGDDENSDGNFIAETAEDLDDDNGSGSVVINVNGTEYRFDFSRSDDNIRNIVTIRGVSEVMKFDGFIVTAAARGSGMLIIAPDSAETSAPQISGSVFSGNANYDGDGGGMSIIARRFATAAPRIERCLFRGNYADFDGGGCHIETNNNSTSNIDFVDCIFEDNAADIDGGGLHNDIGTNAQNQLRFYRVVFDRNLADSDGGGMHLETDNRDTSLTEFYNCVFRDNVAETDGGGYYEDADECNNSLIETSFFNCLFEQNRADTDGGGIHYESDEPNDNTRLIYFHKDCIFFENEAERTGGSADGGAVYADFDNAQASFDFENCVFARNIAGEYGGAIAVEDAEEGRSRIINCTFFDNLSPNNPGSLYGFEDFNDGEEPATFINTVGWGRTDLFGNDNARGKVAVYYSILRDTNRVDLCAFVESSLGYPGFADTTDLDGPDDIWGTADDGLRLADDSPAIGTGINDSLPADLTEDITGAPRIQECRVDMGAYESDQRGNNVAIIATTPPRYVGCIGSTFFLNRYVSDENNVASFYAFYEGDPASGGTFIQQVPATNGSISPYTPVAVQPTANTTYFVVAGNNNGPDCNDTASFEIQVAAIAQLGVPNDTTVVSGTTVDLNDFQFAGTMLVWQNNNLATGIFAYGYGQIPVFVAAPVGSPTVSTITAYAIGGGCPSLPGQFKVTVVPANIRLADASDDAILLYPNPARDHVSIAVAPDAREVDYQIWSTHGKMLRQGHIDAPGATFRLELEDLAAGTYMFRVTVDGQTYSRPFVKQ